MIGMTIKGGTDLGQALKRVSSTVRADLLEEAVVPQADAVAELARGKTRSRRIAREIRTEVAELDDQHIDVVIGLGAKPFFAKFEEFGTQAHEVGDAGIHPGTTGKPFLRPAMDERSEIAVQQIGAAIGDALESLAVS